MGMLYKECPKCKGCAGIMGQYVGFVKCLICKIMIQEDNDSMFAKHNFGCPNCKWAIGFESMGSAECRCVKCDCKMVEVDK